MSNEHTKGPWQYFGADVTDGPVITTLAGDVDDDEVLGVSEWCRLDDADGRLIAAAPELLEALEESLDALISCAVPDDSADREALIQARQSARKAIAKAYGDQT